MSMCIASFRKELKTLDDTLEVWFNDAMGRWQIFRWEKRGYNEKFPGIGFVGYLQKIRDSISIIQNPDKSFRPLDMRAIWELWAGDTHRSDFKRTLERHDMGVLYDDKNELTEGNSITVKPEK